MHAKRYFVKLWINYIYIAYFVYDLGSYVVSLLGVTAVIILSMSLCTVWV